jgi:UDP-N-acetylglucosamine:LPS N-acetylglucosamine transferase
MKKKVLIFTCIGGGGHLSASNALEQYLKNDYEVEQLDIFADPIGHIDPIYWLSFKRYSGEHLYNFFMRHRMFRSLNFYFYMGCFFFWLNEKRIVKNLIKTLKTHKPDLIVSVIPIINHCCVQAAAACNIPFIMTPTDLDCATFVRRMHLVDDKPFHLALSFDHPLIAKAVSDEGISQKHVQTTGFVLRPSFFTSQPQESIKKHFTVPEGVPVITLMMGAIGSNTLIRFVKILALLSPRVHLIICVGRNTTIQTAIEKLSFSPSVTYTIVGFTDQVAHLLSITDLFITKSGSVSFCEGLYSNTPMLLDATSTVLRWERLNHVFIENIGGGMSIRSYSQLFEVVSQLLSHPDRLAQMRTQLEHLHKKNGAQEICAIVDSYLK